MDVALARDEVCLVDDETMEAQRTQLGIESVEGDTRLNHRVGSAQHDVGCVQLPLRILLGRAMALDHLEARRVLLQLVHPLWACRSTVSGGACG